MALAVQIPRALGRFQTAASAKRRNLEAHPKCRVGAESRHFVRNLRRGSILAHTEKEPRVRLQLFEWMDQTWLPRRVRDAMRAYLSVAYRATPLPNLWATELAAVLRAGGETRVVDLGSGAAGPVNLVVEALEAQGLFPQVTLTDLYPVERAPGAHRNVRYWPEPVDARAVPSSLPGTRTMFAAFHHCRPHDAIAILRDAFTHRRAICIFEATSRTPIAILLSCLIPVLVLVLTPSIRPRPQSQ